MIKKLVEEYYTTIYDIVFDEKHATGTSVNIPNTDLEILQIRCKNGMLFCGIFNLTEIEKLEIPAGVFSAPTFEVMLESKPTFLTQAALNMGASLGMTGRELLMLLAG